MQELMRTNDAVLVSFVVALLSEAGLFYHVADVNMSIVEGSIGVFPRRVLVAEDDAEAAIRLMREAGLGHELSTERASADTPHRLPPGTEGRD